MQSVIDKLKQLATEMKDRSHYAYLFVGQLEEIIVEIENPWRPIDEQAKNGKLWLCTDGFRDYYAAQYVELPDDDSYWQSPCGQPVVYSPDPTHYMPNMPLPQPPSEGDA